MLPRRLYLVVTYVTMGSPGNQVISTRIAREARNYISTIADLAYLIEVDAERPEIKSYAEQIQERALALAQFLDSVRKT